MREFFLNVEAFLTCILVIRKLTAEVHSCIAACLTSKFYKKLWIFEKSYVLRNDPNKKLTRTFQDVRFHVVWHEM